MRTWIRVGLVLLLALALSTSAHAQTSPPRFSLNATVGPSFANLGTSMAATAGVNVSLNDYVDLTGELGALPRAPIDDADKVLRLPVANPRDGRLHAYHWNGNVRVRPFSTTAVSSYLTAGAGAFTAEALVADPLLAGAGEARRLRSDLATNVGAGLVYRLNSWLGIGADYRTFFLHRDDDTPRVHRVTAGLTFGMR
jgi:hypothetical protein